jgi:hypothetical protein
MQCLGGVPSDGGSWARYKQLLRLRYRDVDALLGNLNTLGRMGKTHGGAPYIA